jgi:hypothetical protein
VLLDQNNDELLAFRIRSALTLTPDVKTASINFKYTTTITNAVLLA